MTASILMTDCPTEETLASYLDDRLDHETRRKVTEHLATCGECKELVLMATDYQENEANVRRGTFGSRRLAAVAGLAAAAALAFVLQPILFGPDLDDVIEASQTRSHRTSEGRLSGGFAHKEEPRRDRGPGNGLGDDSGEKARLYEVAADLLDAKFADPHVVGLTDLLLAETKMDFDGAVKALETAFEKSSGGERDSIAIDLAAALLGRERWRSEREHEDAVRALNLSNNVLKRKQRPEAAWNRAVALELLDRDAEAVRAWDEYLRLDPSSEWAKDATARKARLTQRDF